MRTRIQLALASILFLFVLSCSKDSANSNYSSVNSGSSSNANRQILSSQTSNAEAAVDAQADLAIVGKWVLYYDWNCDGSPSTSIMTFNADYTWSDDENYTGIWISGRHMFSFSFDDNTILHTNYAGVTFSNAIKGIMSTFEYPGSLQGCFNMVPYTGTEKIEKQGNYDLGGKKK